MPAVRAEVPSRTAMISASSKEWIWPCSLLRSPGPTSALPLVSVWPRVNYCPSGFQGPHLYRRGRGTRPANRSHKAEAGNEEAAGQKGKRWVRGPEADRTGQVALPPEEGRRVRRSWIPGCSALPAKLLQGILAPLPAKAFPKAERTVQASSALSRRWAGPRGSFLHFVPALKPHGSTVCSFCRCPRHPHPLFHTCARPRTRRFPDVHLTFADPQVPTGQLRPTDLVSRAANSLELPGLRDPLREVFQSPAGTRPRLLTQVQSNAPRGPGLSRA